jgi:hypothetical protein
MAGMPTTEIFIAREYGGLLPPGKFFGGPEGKSIESEQVGEWESGKGKGKSHLLTFPLSHFPICGT